MADSTNQLIAEAQASYSGRWVALIRGKIVGQGGTPQQAQISARSRFKENCSLTYIPTQVPLSFPPLLDHIAKNIPEGVEVYLVGGAVRDALMGRPSHDLDFVTPRDAIGLAHDLANRLGAAYYPMDLEHDTGRVILIPAEGSRTVMDFTSLRGKSLDEDLAARDFTANALAVNIRDPQKLLDPLGGASDILAKKLRACSPASFEDDPVRIMRGVRQALALGFTLLPATVRLMRAGSSGLVRISQERLRDELFRTLDGPHPHSALLALDKIGALPFILPEMEALKGVQQSLPHRADVWNHTLGVLAHFEKVLEALSPVYDPDQAANLSLGLAVLRLGRFRHQIQAHLAEKIHLERSLRALLFFAALYHDIEKPSSYSVDADGRIRFFGHDEAGAHTLARRAHELRLSNPEADRVKTIIREHMRPFLLSQGDTLPTPRAVYRFFRQTGPAGVDICLLSLADFLATYENTLDPETWARHLDVVRILLENWWEKPQQSVAPPPLVNGRDLIQEFKLAPGPRIGDLLEAIREAQAEGQIDHRDQALAWARKWLAGGSSFDEA